MLKLVIQRLFKKCSNRKYFPQKYNFHKYSFDSTSLTLNIYVQCDTNAPGP